MPAIAAKIGLIWKPIGWLFGPLVTKEMRTSSRRGRYYALRFGYIAVLAMFVAGTWLATVEGVSETHGAARANAMTEAGLDVVASIAWFQFIAAHLVTVILLSGAINGEIYHRTMVPLLSTPISASQIVTGKLLAKVFQVGILLLISLPLLAIIRVFGGVPWSFVIASVFVTLSSCLVTGVVAIFFSIVIRKPVVSIVATLGALVVVYGVAPAILAIPLMIVEWILGGNGINGFLHLNPFAAMGYMTSVLFDPSQAVNTTFLWWAHCLLMVLGAFLLSWLAKGALNRYGLRRALDSDSDPDYQLVPLQWVPAGQVQLVSGQGPPAGPAQGPQPSNGPPGSAPAGPNQPMQHLQAAARATYPPARPWPNHPPRYPHAPPPRHRPPGAVGQRPPAQPALPQAETAKTPSQPNADPQAELSPAQPAARQLHPWQISSPPQTESDATQPPAEPPAEPAAPTPQPSAPQPSAPQAAAPQSAQPQQTPGQHPPYGPAQPPQPYPRYMPPPVVYQPVPKPVKLRSVKGSAITWKEFLKPLAGSRTATVVILTVGGALLAQMYFILAVAEQFREPGVHGFLASMYLGFMLLASLVLSATTISSEKESRCWLILLATPLSDHAILRAKALSVVRRTWPLWALFVGHLVLFSVFTALNPIVVLHGLLLAGGAVAFQIALGIFFSARSNRNISSLLWTGSVSVGLWGLLPGMITMLGQVAGVTERDNFASIINGWNPFIAMWTLAAGATGDWTTQRSYLYEWPSVDMSVAQTTAWTFVVSLGYLLLAVLLTVAAVRYFRRRAD